MRLIGKIFGGLFFFLTVAMVGAYVWFWGIPVGVNNYVNKQSVLLLIDSPELLTNLGLVDNTLLDFHSDKLADYTKAQDEKFIAKLKKARAGLNEYGPAGLEGQELISWRISAWFFDDIIRQAEIDYGDYPINQFSGVTVDLPSFLSDAHVIISEQSVKRYISRLSEFGRVLAEVKVRVEDHEANGVVAPDFVIASAIQGMQSFIKGGAEANPLVTTLPEKLDKIEVLGEDKKAAYLAAAKAAVTDHIIPGYEAMIELHERLSENANHDAGIWRIPDGDKIYAAALKSNTTTDFTAEEIHTTGLSEVARIEQEMDAILVEQSLTEGTVAERVQRLMEDPAHQFPNTDGGRKDMLAYLEAFDGRIMENASDYFITLPPQALEIVRVPEFSQDSAAGGYYSPPAFDGSRPGRFYINQKDTADNPKWTLPTLMVHEGSPGHHFQLSASQLVEDVPLIRKVSPFTAYTEGWALYAERIAKTDMGIYDDDPLADLGRLQAEIFRAVRLVVDTGIHYKRWSREAAIAYMLSKTGMTNAEVTREIERYVVLPGQATAYKIGQLAILQMREDAEAALGNKFDIREFHETVLLNGGMPLGILEDVVRDWVAKKLAGA